MTTPTPASPPKWTDLPVGARLHHWRTFTQVSLRALERRLAAAGGPAISYASIQRYEAGHQTLPVELAARLTAALGVSLAVVLERPTPDYLLAVQLPEIRGAKAPEAG